MTLPDPAAATGAAVAADELVPAVGALAVGALTVAVLFAVAAEEPQPASAMTAAAIRTVFACLFLI